MPQRRITYVSRVQRRLSEVDIQELWGVALVANRRLDLSGVLVYTGQHFFQVIEGAPHAVEELMQAIRVDARHADLRVLCDELTPLRRFAQWHSAVVSYPEVVDELRNAHAAPGIGCDEATRLTERLMALSARDGLTL